MVRHGLIAVVVLSLLAATSCFLPSLAAAGGSVNAILTDASDGIVDGSYSAATVRAAIRVVRSDPVYSQYSDIEGVLVDYLATFTANGDGGSGGGGSGNGGSGTDQPGPSTGSTPASGPAETSNSPRATHTDSSRPEGEGQDASASPGAAQAGRTPLPVVSGWQAAGVRFAAMPWFFAFAACALVVGVVLVARRLSR